jgi:hypothetical protein
MSLAGIAEKSGAWQDDGARGRGQDQRHERLVQRGAGGREPSRGQGAAREGGTGRILGAHLLGPEASGLINFFGLAMRTGLTANDLKQLVSAYPSAASDLGYRWSVEHGSDASPGLF